MTKFAWPRWTRQTLAGVGFLAAGLLTGCQTTPQVIRGDGTTSAPMVNSPAFAQVAAGQHLPVNGPGMVAGRAPNQPLMAGQPVVGSGGAVYPVNYTGQPTHGVPQPHMVAAPMQPMPMPAPLTQPAPTGQIVGVVQTPTGPQYVYAEAPAPAPVTPIPAVTHTPPVMIGAPATVPMAPPMIAPAPAYAPPPSATPTFVAPPPTTIPLPVLQAPPPTVTTTPAEVPSFKAPEMIPPSVGMKPLGVTLPVPGSTNPALGSYPGVPVLQTPTTIQAGARLPVPAGKPVDDDIPDAPIFVPR